MDKLRALRAFVCVAREGTLARAARVLNVVPAAVSRHLSDLEAQLDARLINRTTRSLALTQIGKRYLPHAQQILESLDEGDTLVRDEIDLPRGQLRVKVASAFAYHQLVQRLGAFRAECPQVALEVSVDKTVTTIDEHFDVCVLMVDRDLPDNSMVARQLASSEIVSCAAPGYLERRGRPSHPSDLEGHDLVLPHNLHPKVDFTRARPGSARQGRETVTVKMHAPMFNSNDIELNYLAVLAEVGVAGLPSFVVARALQDGRLEQILGEWHVPKLRLYAAVPTHRNLPARTRAFIDFLCKCFGGKDVDPWLTTTGSGSHGARQQP